MQSHNNLFLVNYMYYGWYQLTSVIQNTYYHLNTTHILSKKNKFDNKMSITDRLMISLSRFQVEVINLLFLHRLETKFVLLMKQQCISYFITIFFFYVFRTLL